VNGADIVRQALESTLLGSGVTPAAAVSVAEEARSLGIAGVCVAPAFVPDVERVLLGSSTRVVTVVNFPYGDLNAGAAERVAAEAILRGAQEVDLVAPLHLIDTGRYGELEIYIRCVLGLHRGHVPFKVILETARWSDEQVAHAARASVNAGAAWLKTSTGMLGPDMGATEHAVRLLRQEAPAGVGVKASGGVRSRAQAEAMIQAGADRIGTSAAADILNLAGRRAWPGAAAY
jgi:deoxyribose-phosphate aldolase